MARCWDEGHEAVLEVVEHVEVLVLVAADDGAVGRRRHGQAQAAPCAGIHQHVVLQRELPVRPVEVEHKLRQRHRLARRRRPLEARVQNRGIRNVEQGQRDLRREGRADSVIRWLREVRDGGAGVDDGPARAVRVVDGEHRRVDGQQIAADADARHVQEVHRGKRRVDDERRGLHRLAAGVGAVQRGVHAEVEPAGHRRQEGGEAVGEPGGAQLADQRQGPPPEADHAGAVGERASVQVPAPERDARQADPGLVGAERERLVGEDAGSAGAVAVEVLVDAHLLVAERVVERVARRGRAAERPVRGGPRRVEVGRGLVDAEQARRALRPDEVAAGVEDGRVVPRRRADPHLHQVLAVAGEHQDARRGDRVARRQRRERLQRGHASTAAA
uniref:Uncharacterized protein n=1 Tax=Zea mays TaxID=4577 RepID=A0A804MNR8_MAIZE